MSEERVRVLLVDDEASLRVPLKKLLERNYGYQVDAAADSRSALDLVEEQQGRYDVALIDEVLTVGDSALSDEPLADNIDGIWLMQQIKAHHPDLEGIIFTGWGRESRQRAIRAGAFRYLEKPFDYDELAMVIRTAAQQVRLRAISRGVLSEKDPERVLKGIMVAACSLALADEAAIVLREPISKRLHVHTSTFKTDPQWKRHFRGQNLSEYIIKSGLVVRIPDTRQDERVNPRVIEVGIQAFLGLPIPSEEGNQGVLYVYSQRPGWFEEWGTVAVLQTLAGQAGLALANAHAFQRVDTHARYMEALGRASRGLTQTTQLEDQLGLAWDFVREQLQVSTFFVALYDRKSQTLQFPLVYEEETLLEIHPKRKGDQWGVSGHVIESGREVLWATPDEKAQQCRAIGIDPIRVGKECQSCVYLPLKIGGNTIGTVSIQSTASHAFPPALLNAFRALGGHLSVALENSRLFSELAEAKEWRDALIENAFDAVVAIDQNRKVTVFNKRAEEMFGHPASEIVGQTTARLYTDVKKAKEVFDLVNREGSVKDWEVELKNRKGDRIPALVSATLIRDSRGHPSGQAGYIRNLRQARLLEERLRALIETNKAITEILEPAQVLPMVIRSAVAAFPAASGGSIHLYDERADLLIMKANTYGYSPSAIAAAPFRPGEGVAGWVFQYDQPAVVRDVGTDARHKSIAHPEISRQKSMICVPLHARQRVIGTLSLDNSKIAGAFQDQDLSLLSTFANQAAIAIDNARRMQELEQMRRAAEAMSRALTPRQALQQIVESAAGILQADSVALWSYDDVGHKFIPEELVAIGIPDHELERFREEEPQPGRTAETVMNEGYIAVTDVADPQYSFLGDSTRQLLQRIKVQSFQGIALTLGSDERLGVLYANYSKVRTFSSDEEATLRTFANHAALAFKNARLLAQMQRTREAAGVIAGVTVQEDLDQTLQTIAQNARQILGSDAVNLYAYNETTGQFDGWAADILQPRNPGSARPPEELTAGSVVWNILRLSEPPYYCVTNDEAVCHAQLGGYFIRMEDIQAAMGIQLRVGERRVGVMFVNFRSTHRFSSDEIATIQLFADQAAVAIRNAQLYKVMRGLYDGLLSAGKAALEAAELYPEALQVIADAVQEISGSHIVTMYAYYEQEREITYPSIVAGELLQREKQADWTIAQGSRRIRLDDLDDDVVLSRLLRERKSVYASDVTQEPIWAHSAFVSREEVKSSAAILLKTGERIVGILFVNYRTPHVFSQEEQDMLNLFATQAAIAIQNIQQYAELRQAQGLVGARTALAWMGMASSTWRHAIDKHALTIREQVQLLRKDWQSVSSHPKNAKIPKRIATIERLATQILDRPITPPLSAEEGVDSVPLNSLIGERAKQLWENDPYRKANLSMDLQLANDATVRASSEWLRRAFDVLVDNAVEAVAKRPVREIAVGTRPFEGGAEIWVSDTGPGIAEEIRAKIGLELIEKPEDAQGLGMGLLMAQTIVLAYYGKIRVVDTGPAGTTMAIWLPLERLPL